MTAQNNQPPAEQAAEEPDAGPGSQDQTPVPRPMPEHPVLRTLFESFPDAVWGQSRGQDTATLGPDDLRAFAAVAQAEGFEMCVDVTAVDYLHNRRPRFEVVASLISHQHNLRLRIRVPVPDDAREVPSLVPVYPGANFFEREVYDMFGIRFEGHPDLTRILMPDDWEGHPLRKDFPTGAVPVQFKQSHKVV